MTKSIESTDTVELREADLNAVTGGRINVPHPTPQLAGLIVKETAIIDGQVQGNYYNW
jgi:hypothetical protein